MINPKAAPPIVVMFERHWEVEPKTILNDMLPQLFEQGYDYICTEAPCDFDEGRIFSSITLDIAQTQQYHEQAQALLVKAGIKNANLFDMCFFKLFNLMQQKVSSQDYIKIAEKIKELPAAIACKALFENALKWAINIKAVDIESNKHEKMMALDITQRHVLIDKNEKARIAIMTENLLKLHAQGKGVVFICGAAHANNLMEKLTKHNMSEHVVYYFPHSPKRYDTRCDDISKCFASKVLEGHTFCLNEPDAQIRLMNRILSDIKRKNLQYKEEVSQGISHSHWLNEFFKLNFRAFIRPGFQADALWQVESNTLKEQIVQTLKKVKILSKTITLAGVNYLVIPNINHRIVAENIRKLK